MRRNGSYVWLHGCTIKIRPIAIFRFRPHFIGVEEREERSVINLYLVGSACLLSFSKSCQDKFPFQFTTENFTKESFFTHYVGASASPTHIKDFVLWGLYHWKNQCMELCLYFIFTAGDHRKDKSYSYPRKWDPWIYLLDDPRPYH